MEIADPLLEQIKTLAAREGTSLRMLIDEGLRSVVAGRISREAQPFRLRDGSFQNGQGLQPGVQWADLSTLAYEDDGGLLPS